MIGFHNGGEDTQINGEFTYHRVLGNFYYLPQKRWTAMQQAVDGIMKKEQWQEMSHIQVDGQYVENVDSDRDHISLTVPYIFVRDFDDLADITKQISPALTQLNTIHGEEEYVIESTYDDYQQLFGTLHSSKRMITSVAWFGLFLSVGAIPLLLFFVFLQRQPEFAIRQTLGGIKTEVVCNRLYRILRDRCNSVWRWHAGCADGDKGVEESLVCRHRAGMGKKDSRHQRGCHRKN